MRTESWILFAGLALIGLAASGRATACAVAGLEITGAFKDKIGVFDEGGKFKEEVDKVLALKQKVLKCNEELGLVQVELANQTTAWIDRLEVKIGGDKLASAVCVTQSSSKDHDFKQAVSSGVDPGSAHCVSVAR